MMNHPTERATVDRPTDRPTQRAREEERDETMAMAPLYSKVELVR